MAQFGTVRSRETEPGCLARFALARPSPTREHPSAGPSPTSTEQIYPGPGTSETPARRGAARRHVPRRDFSGPHFLTAGATHAGWVAAAQPPAGVANCPRRPSWFRRLAVHPRIKRANSAVQPCGLFSAAPGTANGEGRGQEPRTNLVDRVAGEIGDIPAGAPNPRRGEVRSSSALQLASHLASRRVSACSAAPRDSQTAHGHKLSPVLLPIVWGTITLPSHSHIVFKCIW